MISYLFTPRNPLIDLNQFPIRAEAEYPKSKKIIDYYHVMKHIGTYIHHVTKTIGDKNKYVKKIGKILKYKGIETVKRYIEKIPRKIQHIKKEYSILTTYFRNNEHMMDYPLYRKSNHLIGSGAIESAHRTVLQKRMKQSGQRWSERGFKNMINLRVIYTSGYKDNVHEIIKNVA